MITEESIIDAYVFLRKKNQSIPDETLDFMKESSLSKLKQMNNIETIKSAKYNCTDCGSSTPIKNGLCWNCSHESI